MDVLHCLELNDSVKKCSFGDTRPFRFLSSSRGSFWGHHFFNTGFFRVYFFLILRYNFSPLVIHVHGNIQRKSYDWNGLERRHLSFANFSLGCRKQMSWQTFQVLFCRLTDEQRDIYRTYLNSQEVKHIFDGRFRVFVGLINLRKICKSCFELQTKISDQTHQVQVTRRFFH